MELDFRQAELKDAELLIDIYNSSFYSDLIRFGECPAYGKTVEMMQRSIADHPKFIILSDNRPVGCVSCRQLQPETYEVGCLCVIPEFQGQGIGTSAIQFVKSHYTDWKRFTLVTPVEKHENVSFYTQKCGFSIESFETDGNVKLARFVLER